MTSLKPATAHPAGPALAALLCCAVGATDARAQTLDILPMTQVNVAAHTGYLSDPYPIRRAPFEAEDVQLLSGTTANILACAYPLMARCFASYANEVDASAIQPDIAAAGMAFHGFQNRDIFQADDGRWHMVVAVGFGPDGRTNRTVIAHASPTVAASPGFAPTRWAVDRVLVGSFSNLEQGNYDCKYFGDKGRLYLLYVKNLRPGSFASGLVNRIVIQPMLSPIRLAPVGPTLLLSPSERYGGFASEQFAATTSKLVEAENIRVINGKYAMAYSTGTYLTDGYKAGVAWSDTLFPEPGHEYRKVLEPDVHGVWHNLSRIDVHYLAQSQQTDWPNYTGHQVIGPGVNSFVRGPGDQWYIFQRLRPRRPAHDVSLGEGIAPAALFRPLADERAGPPAGG